MPEAILITQADVREYRQIDANFDQNRFNSFCNDVQRKSLRGLLGDALYYDLMSDSRVAGKYKDLLDGKDYQYAGNTIHFYGIKPILCYWWLAIAAREGDLFLSSIGAIQFVNNPQQNFESSKSKERISSEYSATAQMFTNDLIQFLGQHNSIYPLWQGGQETRKNNFTSFRI